MWVNQYGLPALFYLALYLRIDNSDGDEMDEPCTIFKINLVLINLISILCTIFKFFGVIEDDIPWWFVAGPLILEAIFILCVLVGMVVLAFYVSSYDSIRKNNRKNSHKKPSLK